MSEDLSVSRSLSRNAGSGASGPSPSSDSTRSTGSSLGRKISNLLPLSRKSTAQEPPRTKNEYGLNTVYQPNESIPVIADLVFVHGLGGGSSTTWCIKSNPESFWPKEWLPKDPDFHGVRVHSFGYNANWKKRVNNPLDIHAFGQSLVEDLLSDPKVKTSGTSIVLIGHSMGGLVIKKACILSKSNPEFASLAKRFHSFYFLGTPHRGAGMAKTLNNLLRLSGTGRRAYIAGLESHSEIIRSLNDGFRVNYAGIHLHTFYESQPTPPLGLIVDMESATLGYAEERSQLLNANHKNLIKFENPDDSNYRSLRNRLAATIQQIRDQCTKIKFYPQSLSQGGNRALESQAGRATCPPELGTQSLSLNQSAVQHEKMERIFSYLAVDHSPDETLLSLDDTRLKGSCSWLLAKRSFQEWLNSPSSCHFYLKGAPASGKSTMASFIVKNLQEEYNPVCYYFFKTGERFTPNLSRFLRSMAYQMCRANPAIRDALFDLAQNGPAIDIRNPKSIWHSIFLSCIFQKMAGRCYFWVLDALDEAAEKGHADDYFLLLSKIDKKVPLKIFFTGRPTFELDNLFSHLPTITELMTIDDSIGDIRLYVDTWSANLPVADAGQRKILIDNIVDMSGGSFLWTVLVVKKLREVLTVEEIHEVLREIPQKMNELYQHNIKSMETSRSKATVKHIIVWAICAIQPLTVDQMKDAIKLSQGITLARNLRISLPYLCGQFLDVDKQSRIRVVHETARAFLTNPSLDSEFRIDFAEGHEIIATACLNYLLGEELKYSKWRRSSTTSETDRSSMTDYVCLRWSEHIFRSSSSSDHLFDLLVRFFQTNVLSWIERVAHLGDLDCLNRTTKHLSSFLGRRAKYVPMLPGDLKAWAVDLPRIAAQFGDNLIKDPEAIHSLIPPFCPRDSAIYRNFGYAEDGIKLVGGWNSGWDDRICSISYHETYTRDVSTRDDRFAVGLADGLIKLYRTSTCEEYLALDHTESLSVLEFGFTAKFVVSAGLRHVKLWEVATGRQVLNVEADSQTLAVAFDESDTLLFVASRDRWLSVYQISNGLQLQRLQWRDQFLEAKDSSFPLTPTGVKISVELQVIAVTYRSKPVQLWSLDDHRPIGACIRPSTHKHTSAGHLVHCTAFNPNTANPGLVVAYWDELLAVYDIKTCKTLASTSVGLDKVAISPNGKTLAGSDGAGAVKILDFETLQFLYKVQVQGDPVTSLVFTSDSLRIIDTRSTNANVWEPLALVGQDSDSQSSEPSESVHHVVDETGVATVDNSAAITSLHYCEESGIAFCGRTDGRVDTCNLDDPQKTMRNLYRHRGGFTSITCIGLAHNARVTVSADTSGTFRIMQITTGARREWSAKLVVEGRLEQGQSIAQVLVHPDGLYVLVSSSGSDSVWSVATKKRVAIITNRRRTTWKWFIRPSTPSQLLLFEDKGLKLFNWADLSELATAEASPPLAHIECDEVGHAAYTDADAISISSDGEDLVFMQKMTLKQQAVQVMPSNSSAVTKIHVFDLSSLVFHPIPSVDSHTHFDKSNLLQHSFSTLGPGSVLQTNKSPQLKNALPTPPSNSGQLVTPALKTRGSRGRRPSVRNVADVPDVETIIGTVKRFNSWFLVFISREGWVCSVDLDSAGRNMLETFQKHFLIPSIWRTANPHLISKIRRGQDIIFVHQDGVIVVNNGLDNGQHVPFTLVT